MTATERLKHMVAELTTEARKMSRLEVSSAKEMLVLSECISACLTGYLLTQNDNVPSHD